MFAVFGSVGLAVRNIVLYLASLLKLEAAPGLATLALLCALIVGLIFFLAANARRRQAIGWLRQHIEQATDKDALAANIDVVSASIEAEASSAPRRQIAEAWKEYRATLITHEADGQSFIRNAVRPSIFFNADDLNFGPGFWKVVPGLFVTIGLFLTFLGLISALSSMDLTADKVQNSLRDLLTIASAKFIMSLTGLFCSIIFTIVLHRGTSCVSGALHGLSAVIEKRVTFISLEDIAIEQLSATREQREHFRLIGMELVAELGRPLREELPQAISASISATMAPLLQQVGKSSAMGMNDMVKDLSSRFSDEVGQALAKASDSLVQAGDRIAHLSERMDQSSGRVGSEIDAAVNRLTQAVEDLRGGMNASAKTANDAFSQGAEQLLAGMNQTLQAISANTEKGALAIGAAATEMREAAAVFRSEIKSASSEGREAVAQQLVAAGNDAASSIGASAKTANDAFSQGAEQLLAAMNHTLQAISANTDKGALAIGAAATEMREAATVFRSEIKSASSEGREAVAKQLAAAGNDAASRIGATGESITGAFARMSKEVAEQTDAFAAKTSREFLAPISSITEQLGDIVTTLADGAAGMRRLSDGVRAGAEASEKAAGNFRGASQELVAAVVPIHSANARIEAAVTQLRDSTESAANTVVRSSQATAQSAAQILAAAQKSLDSQSNAISQAVGQVTDMLGRLKGQGDRLDTMDEKLGKAFDQYTHHVAVAVESLFGHVRTMQQELAPALDTLRVIVEQAEQFSPQSKQGKGLK